MLVGKFIVMTLQLTASAIQAANDLKNEVASYKDLDLRLYLAGKHCDGFEYGVSFDARAKEDKSFRANDSINIICDPQTFEFVSGSVIDWVDDERGRGFLVNNPNHRRFRGKFFKKSEWKKKFTDAGPPSKPI